MLPAHIQYYPILTIELNFLRFESASWIAKFICDCRFTSLWALVKKNHIGEETILICGEVASMRSQRQEVKPKQSLHLKPQA